MNDVVKFLVENWYLLIAGVGVAVAAGFMLYRFFKLPTKEQIAKIKEWLLYAVTEAEKELGGGTGQLKLRPYQTLHFELGRAVVGQCGSLISKVLYVKQGTKKKFAILDAGMTDLIRPALYQAYHKMENITSEEPVEAYDVVGPICESSDVFGKAIDLNKVKRGDLIALRSAGAYGEIMASGYNCRELPKGYTSDELV